MTDAARFETLKQMAVRTCATLYVIHMRDTMKHALADLTHDEVRERIVI